jgi:hypothetical protein
MARDRRVCFRHRRGLNDYAALVILARPLCLRLPYLPAWQP